MKQRLSMLMAGALVAVLTWACQEAGPLDPDRGGLAVAKKPDNPGGGNGGNTCDLRFDLTITPTTSIDDDNGGTYSNGTDRVAIFGGDGGWRFDTNGSQKLDMKNDVRKVSLTVAGEADGTPRGIDMRFAQNSAGLNFCDLANVGDSGQVPVILMFTADDGSRGTVRYGGQTLDGNTCLADEVTVTRTAAGWTMASNAAGDACLVEEGGVLGADVQVPFSFALTQQ